MSDILSRLENQINQQRGITLPHFINDGRKHYFPDPFHTHKPKNSAGHYNISQDGTGTGVAIAYIGSYWTGSPLNEGSQDRRVIVNSSEQKGNKISLNQEQIEYLKKKDAERKEKKRQKNESTASVAKKVIANAELITDMQYPHPYLLSRQIPPIGLYKQKRWNGKEVLIAPAQNVQGDITGYQSIFPDGFKATQKEFNITGSSFQIGTIDPVNSHKIYVCEGVATGISVYVSTGITVRCVFSAFNLGPTALALKEAFPNHTIVGIADHDDQWKKIKRPHTRGITAWRRL